MEGARKRFAIQKPKIGDGMLLCNCLANKKRGGGVCGTEKLKLELIARSI